MLGATGLVIGIYLLLLVLVAPLGLVMFQALSAAVGASALGEAGASHVPIAAWEPFARHRSGLVETFVPRILGAAAPVDTLSGLMDGRLPPPIAAAGALVYAMLWAFLWGGVLARFGGGPSGWSAFARASLRFAAPLARLMSVAVAVYLVALLAIHPLIFDVVLAALPQPADERTQFLMRGSGYAVYGLLLAVCSVLVDYARIEIVLSGRVRVRDAIAGAWHLLRRCTLPVSVLALLTTLLLAGAIAGYVAFDVGTRGAADPWLAIAVGQAYIAARLVARLVTAAAQVELAKRCAPAR